MARGAGNQQAVIRWLATQLRLLQRRLEELEKLQPHKPQSYVPGDKSNLFEWNRSAEPFVPLSPYAPFTEPGVYDVGLFSPGVYADISYGSVNDIIAPNFFFYESGNNSNEPRRVAFAPFEPVPKATAPNIIYEPGNNINESVLEAVAPSESVHEAIAPNIFYESGNNTSEPVHEAVAPFESVHEAIAPNIFYESGNDINESAQEACAPFESVHEATAPNLFNELAQHGGEFQERKRVHFNFDLSTEGKPAEERGGSCGAKAPAPCVVRGMQTVEYFGSLLDSLQEERFLEAFVQVLLAADPCSARAPPPAEETRKRLREPPVEEEVDTASSPSDLDLELEGYLAEADAEEDRRRKEIAAATSQSRPAPPASSARYGCCQLCGDVGLSPFEEAVSRWDREHELYGCEGECGVWAHIDCIEAGGPLKTKRKSNRNRLRYQSGWVEDGPGLFCPNCH